MVAAGEGGGPDRAERSLRSAPRRMALGYALLAGLWILLSDMLVASENWPGWAQTAKGWLFVTVTAAGLYVLTARFTRQVLGLHAALRRHAEELETRVEQRTAELVKANRELDTFVHAASHDLRAPLRSVAGFAEALREDYGHRLDAGGHEHLDRILRGAERMDTLVTNLRDYNRLARRPLELGPVPLEPVVETVMKLLCADVRARGAEVSVTRPLPAVLGEAETLTHAVQNLVDNALKFTAPGVPARVCLRAEPRGARTRLWVEDQGIGIPADRLGGIFEPFERLHPMDMYPGTGLGLAIVRRGVERLGGTVGVESVAGAGSRFWIELATAPAERMA